MSLPSAKGIVTDPIENARLERDVDRKLKIYTTLAALRESKLPSNSQLDSWLNVASKTIGTDGGQGHTLSRQGQTLCSDLRDIIKTFSDYLTQKNGDELLQDFIYSTRDVDTAQSLKSDKETGKDGTVLGVEKDKAREDGQRAAHHLRTLLNLLLTNSEARKLVSDFSVVGRDLVARGLGKASEGLRPDEEKLRGVDEAHRGEGGAFVASPQDRAREQDEKGLDGMVKARVPDEHKETLAQTSEDVSRVQDTAHRTMKDARGQDLSPSEVADVTKEEAKDEGKKRGLMDRFKDAIPGEHQDKAKDHFNRGKEFLTEDYFPRERREQWIYRGKKVILECQSHPEYQDSLRWLLSYIKEYASHGRRIANEGGGKVSGGVQENTELQSSMSQLRALAERFANGRSLQNDIWDPVNALIDDAQRDKEFRDWWEQVGEWVEKVLLAPGYVIEPACNTRGKELFEAGKKFYGSGESEEVDDPTVKASSTVPGTAAPTDVSAGVGTAGTGTAGAGSGGLTTESAVRGKYRTHFDRVFEGVGKWVGGISEDPLNRRMGTDVQRLTKDLLFDSEGKLSFKPDLWDDVRSTILPSLIDKIGLIPIPRIEYTDESIDLVVENLTLSGRNLFPNLVEVEVRNWVRFGTGTVTGKKDTHRNDATNKHTLTLHLSQIQADMRDVAFYFRKKSGMPKLKDSGLADVVLGGSGMSATIELVSSQDPSTLFDIKKIDVKVDVLKFAIRDSRHDVLYKVVKPLASGLIKKQIQKAVADGIRTGLEWVGEELVAVKNRMDEAKAGAGTEEEEIGRWKAMQEAFKRRKDDTASTTSGMSRTTSGSQSQFKVVSNKRNSLLAKEGHPSGWVNRLDEKEKTITQPPAGAAAQGNQGWRSKAFDAEV